MLAQIEKPVLLVPKSDVLHHITAPMYVIKTDESQGIVEHIISVMGIIDTHTHRIHNGSYKKTIAENLRNIKVLDMHRAQSVTDVVGKPIALAEIGRSGLPTQLLRDFPDATGGLLATTQYNLKTQKGLESFHLIAAGDITEYSVGIYILDFDDADEDVNGITRNVLNIRTVKLVEYSNVIWGANPATQTVTVKRADDDVNVEVSRIVPLLLSAPSDKSEPANETSDAATPQPAEQTPEQQPVDEPDDADTELTALTLSIADLTLQNVQADDMTAARRIEKTLASHLTERQIKAMSIGHLLQMVRVQFYRNIDAPDFEHDWWINNVYPTFLTVYDSHDARPGRFFAIDYAIELDTSMVNFADRAEWREGTYEFTEGLIPSPDGLASNERSSGSVVGPEAPPTTSQENSMNVSKQAGLDRLKQLKITIEANK